MSKSFTISKSDLTAAQYAIDTLTGNVAIEDDIAAGIGVLRNLIVNEGATIADLVAITGRSRSNIGRVRSIVTLSRTLDADLPGAGILRTNSAVNAANKITGLNFVKAHVDVWIAEGRRFASWNAIADAVEAVNAAATAVPTVGSDEAEEAEAAPSDKTEAERFADLIAQVSRHARKFGLEERDVAVAIFDHFDKSDAELADEAADEAELAS